MHSFFLTDEFPGCILTWLCINKCVQVFVAVMLCQVYLLSFPSSPLMKKQERKETESDLKNYRILEPEKLLK